MRAEDRFVERLREMLLPDDAILLGPGDDAAVLRRAQSDGIATTDMLVEGVDFFPGEDPERLGRRAVSVNLSDAAAMGARPRLFLLSIAVPAEREEDFALAVCRGAIARGREHGAALAGGDLSRAPCVFVSVTLWGDLEGAPLTRSGALPGDLLFLSGATGRAAAGLRLAREIVAETAFPGARELLDAFHDPEPRVALGLALSRRKLAHAAIDVSDGLGADAARIASASAVRVVLERERVPISASVAAAARHFGVDPLPWVLSGGDDYEILFAVPEEAAASVEALPGDVSLTRVGRVERGSGAVLRGAAGDADISALGYDHFERAPKAVKP
ncbi:MAG: thiamine-phosphate kinase [Acidobacteriota bacterium]|nr:thiamine-phosphate kinase [Acidobacteriota bacterium]